MTLFRKGQLHCPRGHHVKERDFLLAGHGAVFCDRKTPSSGGKDQRSDEGRCGIILYIIAGFNAFEGDVPLGLRLAVEITPAELREISQKELSIPAACEYLGLAAWTRR